MDSTAPVLDREAAKTELQALEHALLSFVSNLKKQPGVDQRSLATAITQIQTGVMWAGAGIYGNKTGY